MNKISKFTSVKFFFFSYGFSTKLTLTMRISPPEAQGGSYLDYTLSVRYQQYLPH